MGLRDLAKKLKVDAKTLDSARLQQRFDKVDATAISDMTCRTRTRISGEVKRMRVAPRQGVPALEVVVSDGTGDAVAVFTGRRAIGGIEHGRAMMIEGVARDERGRRILMNPSYTLL